ncbi:CRISPR-associated helicase Cas3' [Secundilactobacillus muriivasis]
MNYIAHIGRDDDRTQSLSEHLITVRTMCEEWGQTIGLEHVCGLAGLLHDMGKFSDDFQQYIRRAHRKDPRAVRGSVDHSSAGGIWLMQKFQKETNPERRHFAELLAELVGNAIYAHHNPAGALDYNGFLSQSADGKQPVLKNKYPFLERMDKLNDPDYGKAYSESKERFLTIVNQSEFNEYYDKALKELQKIGLHQLIDNQYFYLRFILSTIIDADHTDTADFETKAPKRKPTPSNCILKHYYKVNEKVVTQQIRDNQRIASKQLKRLNALRQEMSDACVEVDSMHNGIYTLSVPTGGGKTFSSLRFGLNKASKSETERLIYIVPFTTIIEQNADAIRDRLNGDSKNSANILEYHSAVNDVAKDVADHAKSDAQGKIMDGSNLDTAFYYMRDTWDAPIILTTQVAYLDALFGSGSKNIRHMHRLVNSVLIFDEIQAMPLKCIGLNNLAMTWLSKCKTTSLLCTATQPALENVKNGNESDKNGEVHGITIEKEIVPDLPTVEEAFKRVEIVPDFTQLYDLTALMNLIDERLKTAHSLLVILNTKSAVKSAYEAFQDGEDAIKYHLSTSMCQKNRQYKFAQIKESLAQIDNQKVVVFSTNLIEAGVDLSFEAVIRSSAGLDSVIQAAGRCNRNHETDMGKVNLIRLTDDFEHLNGLPQIQLAAEITEIIAKDKSNLVNGKLNLMTASVIKNFFEEFYKRCKSQLSYPIFDHLDLYHLIYGDLSKKEHPSKQIIKALSEHVGTRKSTMLTVSSQIISKCFNVIDSPTTDVIVEYSTDMEKKSENQTDETESTDIDNVGEADKEKRDTESHDIITALISEKSEFGKISALLKAARPYTVSVYGNTKQGTLKKLIDEGAISYYEKQNIWVALRDAYDVNLGLGSKVSSNFDPSQYIC